MQLDPAFIVDVLGLLIAALAFIGGIIWLSTYIGNGGKHAGRE